MASKTNINHQRLLHMQYPPPGHYVSEGFEKLLFTDLTPFFRDVRGRSDKLKLTLFEAQCRLSYTCRLWLKFTQRSFNNGFRML